MAPEAFVFESYAYDEGGATLSLRYRFDKGPEFEETLVFQPPRRELSGREREALDRVFRLILLFCGVSYYKTFIPPRLRCEAFAIDPANADFLRQFYEKGLAEFAYRNHLSLEGRIAFETSPLAAPAPIALDLPRRTLVHRRRQGFDRDPRMPAARGRAGDALRTRRRGAD